MTNAKFFTILSLKSERNTMIIDSTTYRSPDYRSGKRRSIIDMIVLHATETNSLEETARCFMTEKERTVSVHYVIDRDGKIYQFVPEDRSAYHAGKSRWRLVTGEEVTNINSRSIGIEFQRGSGQTFTPEQIRAGLELTKSIKNRYNIDPRNVVAHSDIAPSRKSDPGNDFPWELWVKNGLAANASRRGNDGRSSGTSSSIRLAEAQGLFNLNENTTNIYANYLANKGTLTEEQLRLTNQQAQSQHEKALVTGKNDQKSISGDTLVQLLVSIGVSLLTGGNSSASSAIAAAASEALSNDKSDSSQNVNTGNSRIS